MVMSFLLLQLPIYLAGKGWMNVFQKSVPYFVPGANTIRIRVHRDKTDNIFLDWINVKYTRNIVKYAGKQTIVNQLENEYEVPIRYNVSSSTNFTVYQINNFNEASLVPVKNIAGSYYFIASGNTATKYILTNEKDIIYLQKFNLLNQLIWYLIQDR